MRAEVSPLVDFAAGTVGGIAGLLVGHPLDTVKVRLQCQTEDIKYRGAVDCFRKIVKYEGVAGLYKGIVSPLVGVALMNASIFGFYGLFLRMQLPSRDATPTLTQVTVAGMACGITTAFFTSPMDLFKIIQQTAPPHLPEPSISTLLRQLFPLKMWRGLTVTMWRDIGYGPYFLAYEWTKRRLGEGNVEGLIAGGVAGVVGWGCTYPLDVVKSRIQASQPYAPVPLSLSAGEAATLLKTEAARNVEYRTIMGTIMRSYREDGWRVFFRGLGTTLFRGIPVNMATFAAYEACMSYYK